MRRESKLRFTDEEQDPEENAGVESTEAARDSADAGMRQMASHSRRTRQRRKAQSTERPSFSSNPVSRWQQRRAIRKQYAEAKRAQRTAEGTAENTVRAAKGVEKITKKTTALLRSSTARKSPRRTANRPRNRRTTPMTKTKFPALLLALMLCMTLLASPVSAFSGEGG